VKVVRRKIGEWFFIVTVLVLGVIYFSQPQRQGMVEANLTLLRELWQAGGALW